MSKTVVTVTRKVCDQCHESVDDDDGNFEDWYAVNIENGASEFDLDFCSVSCIEYWLKGGNL